MLPASMRSEIAGGSKQPFHALHGAQWGRQQYVRLSPTLKWASSTHLRAQAPRQRTQPPRAAGGIYPPPSGQPGYTGGGRGGEGGSGSGRSGGGDDGQGDDSMPQGGGLLKGWEQRCAADPTFAYKVAIEQIIGVGAAVLGDMSSRPYWGLYELDFVFSTLIVGSIVNFSLMYLLAAVPPTAASASSGSLLQRVFSEQTLRSWGAPTGHMFERGFSYSSRVLNLGYKGFLFALVGMAAGLTGTAISNGLTMLREKLDPNFRAQNTPPNVVLNAATWAAHMGVSSNLRYQILNGLEMVLQPALSPGLFKALSVLVRTGNNVVGGISFVLLAKLFGVQTSQGDAVKEVAKEHKR